LATAEVREATLVSYGGDWEATYQSYGDLDPDEPKPRIRLRLRVHPDGGEPFESTHTWRVPSLCLAAVTAGRLVVAVHPDVPEEFGIDWPRSALLSGVRTCRLLGLDGRHVELTGRPELLLELWSITGSGDTGRIAMDGDTIDLRRVDPARATQLQSLVERAAGGGPTPEPPPNGRARWLVEHLPGEKGAFGGVDRRWARHGGYLVRGRFLELRGTTTFQYDVLDLRDHHPSAVATQVMDVVRARPDRNPHLGFPAP
jgi:hypothetical protein